MRKGSETREFRDIALMLADKQAVETILTKCNVQIINGVLWREETPEVHFEVYYLTIRGVLVRNDKYTHLVKVHNHDQVNPDQARQLGLI